MAIEASDLGAFASMSVPKLSPPELPGGHVSRPALVDALRGARGPVVSVCAPAGYGKTTLLAEWARVEPRRVAWVSLDASDNDPMALVSAVATSFGASQGLDRSFWESMSSPGGSVLGRLGPRLASAFGSSTQPFVLILDDLHEVSTSEAMDVIDLLVNGVAAGSTVAMAGRAEAPSLPRWRVQGNLLELGTQDLSFDPEESARFFQLAPGAVPDDVAEALHTSLEGWVAGLHLALVVARQESFSGFGGNDRFVADYLRRELLDGLSSSDRTFLTRSSVLDELGASVCDAVLGIDDSGSRLHELERANLFLIPLDRNRSRYRFHATFRELLLSELERIEGVQARRGLHRRAAEWFDEQGIHDEAIEHALQSGDRGWTARLLAKVAQDAVAAGRIVTFQRWLDQLGDDVTHEYPPLAVDAGWSAALLGDVIGAERWLDTLSTLAHDGQPADGSASFASARSMFRALCCPAGPDEMLVDALAATAAEPTWGPWRPTADLLAAEALLLRDAESDRDAAFVLLGDAVVAARASGLADTVVVCLAERSLIAMDRDDWVVGRDELAEALALIGACYMEDYLTSLVAYAAGARLALHDGDVAEAGRLAALAMRARGTATAAIPWMAVRLRLVLARVHLAMGEVVAARHLLREADDVLRRRPALGALIGECALVRDLLAAAPTQSGATPLSPAELRVLPYLQTHLSFDEVAQRLVISRHTVGSHARSIYRKLGVTSRGEAVEAARAIGLLGEGL